MDDSFPIPQSPTSSVQDQQQVPPALQNPKRKLYILGAIFAVIIFAIVGLLFYTSSTKREIVSTAEPKTWQIIVKYDGANDKFSLKELKLLDKQVEPDARGAKFSDYELKLLDENKKIISSKKVTVMTYIPDVGMLVDPPEGSTVTPATEFESILYIQHEVNGKHIILTRAGKTVLEIIVPSKKKALIEFPKVDTADAQACRPLQVAFISDGYTDFNKFHQNAQTFADAFTNLPPYNSKNPSIFDFKVVDNSKSLGCVKNGILWCIQNQSPQADQIVRAQYPNVSKIVILVNAGLNNPNDQGAVGVASGIGGDYAVFPTSFGNVSSIVLTIAKHELLGHAVGQLYDRYVATSPNYGRFNSSIRSNCTEKPGGESFWPIAGISGVFKGCGNAAYYAPSAATYCPKPSNPNLSAAGTPASLMSAAGCGGQNFDSVEQYWITNNILPDYEGCPGGATPIAQLPTATGVPNSSSPTVTAAPVNSIVGIVFNDANGNSTRDSEEAGVSGASLTLGGAASRTTTSGNDGRYSFLNLTSGSSYTVTLTYSGQSVTSSSITLAPNLSRAPEVNFAVRPAASGGTDPVITATTPTPVSIPTIPPTGKPSSGGFQLNGTPTPTPEQYYTCNPDPNCIKSGKSIQLCPLVCTPQG